MTEIDASVGRVLALLRSILPWRQRQGLREIARLGRAAAPVLPTVLRHLDSFSRGHRKLAFEALEAAGEEGRDLLLITAGTSWRRGQYARDWMSSRGFGIRECVQLMETGTVVARKYACKRIVTEAAAYPDTLVDVYMAQALRYRQLLGLSTSGRAFGGAGLETTTEGTFYAMLLTALSANAPGSTESLKRYLVDSRAEVREAMFHAWSQSSAGRWLLIEHGMSETDSRANDAVLVGLSQLSAPQREALLRKFEETETNTRAVILRVMRKVPKLYIDQLPKLTAILINRDSKLLDEAAETVLTIAESLGVDEERRVGLRSMIPYGSPVNASPQSHRALGRSVAALCAKAMTIADAMLELLANDNKQVRRAALFLLDIVSISLDERKRAQVAEVLSFAALGESDELGNRSIQDLIRRLGRSPEDNQSGGTLGFLRAA